MVRIFNPTLLLLFFAASSVLAQTTNPPAPDAKAAAYTRTLDERAIKILAKLAVADQASSNRVHGIIVQQYRNLNDIHSERDQQIKNAKAGADQSSAAELLQAARDRAKAKLDKLHATFLAELAGEISAEQVDQVKDGLTYGVLPLTYGVYLKMYPELTAAQQAQIKAWLTEARELAMDGSTAEEKHAVFGNYKGRINNYLSKAGYDAKKAEQKLKQSPQPK